MNKILLLALISFPASLFATQSEPCIRTGSSIDIDMIDAMEQNMKIDISTVIRKKTTTQLIEKVRVNDRLAELYAVNDQKKSPERWLSVRDYKEIYFDDGAENLIVKLVYENNQGKHNIFYASAIVNDYECSIRFNGYIIAQREF